MKIMSTTTSLNHVTELMGRFDAAWVREPKFGQADWAPESPEIAEALEELIAPSNRSALIAWYANLTLSQMNPSARWFCEYLENKTGVSLCRRQ